MNTNGVRDEDAVDGVFWRGPCGSSLCFDVRVTDPRGREGVDAALRTWGGAASRQSAVKHNDYGRDLSAVGWSFYTLIWETHGFATPAVRQLLTAFAAHKFPEGIPLADHHRQAAVQRWRRRLALILQKGNACAALGHGGSEVSGLPRSAGVGSVVPLGAPVVAPDSRGFSGSVFGFSLEV